MAFLSNLFQRKKRNRNNEDPTQVAYDSGRRLESRDKPLLLSAVYRCVDLISDSVATLPLKVYEIDENGFKREAKEHPLYWLLNNEPNQEMTRYTFFKTCTALELLKGNAYAYIDRDDNGAVVQLLLFPNSKVETTFIEDENGERRLRYKIKGVNYLVEPCEMLHFLNFSYDGVNGISTLEHARQSIGLASALDESATEFFESGSAMSGILKVRGVGALTKEKRDAIYKAWKARFDDRKSGGVAVLEGDMDYQQININNRDAQMIESRLFSVGEIARYFSVNPVKLFDLTHSSYSSIEATQLQFLTDTMQPYLVKFEQEINRKLFTGEERKRYVAEFDTTALLRADKAAQSAYYNTMFQIGAMTPNEIRRENNLPKIEGGDTTFIQVNMQPLKTATAPKTED